MSNKNSLNSLILGLCLFAVAFLISRAQFFVCPTVEIQNDSGTYIIWISGHLERGLIPHINVIPIGYPLIIEVVTHIKDSVYSIVGFQLLLTFISFSSFLFIIWRFYSKSIYYLSLVCLMIYVQVPNNLFYDISITSESVYNSSLILLVSALVGFFNNPNKKFASFLSLALALPILFRPNGLFAIVIFLLLIVFIFQSYQKKLLISFIFPFSFLAIRQIFECTL